MLGKKRFLKLMAALFICMTLITVPALAASLEPVFSITTDKKTYTDEETITVDFSVDNVTANTLKNIKLSGATPDGYVSKSGSDASGNWNAEIASVPSGQKGSVKVEFVKKTNNTNNTSTPSTDVTVPAADTPSTGNNKSVKTGDSSKPVLAFAVMVLCLGGLIFLTKSSKGKKILSIILAVVLGLGSFMAVDLKTFAANEKMEAGTPAYAEDESNRFIEGKASKNGTAETRETEIKTSFKINDKDVEIKAKVAYEENFGSQDLSYVGYSLKWQDEFNGTELNREDWNVELHDAGWVNSELQRYVDSTENIYVKDGKLIIKPVKNGDTYTSGRVNTMGKQDYKYGLFEVKAKVPSGKGYLPAFWLMPTDENLYGQWPKCGEIDAMEVMGQNTKKVYGTIHYGMPQSQSQGTKTLSDGDFSDEYHVFAVEWEPGSIKWYVDGMLYHEENDWYSTTQGQGTVSYPAPFDQKFYVILNLAIGGNWVGNPDANTTYDDQEFAIDYVRIFQKDSYDEDVEKPVKEVVLREPDAEGNYVHNGDFSKSEAFDDEEDWILLTTEGGAATASIENGVLKIESVASGTQDYSVQFVQGGIPAEKGATYRLTFDAWADSARTVKVNMDAVDRGWSRYLPDQKINLTDKSQTFSFDYTMSDDDDANSRLEFNLGNVNFAATVYIDNVKIVKIAQENDDGSKGILADGNHVYNGKFQEGKNRLAYWDIDNKAGAVVTVTNDEEHDRRLKIVAPEGTTESNPVTVSQSDLAVKGEMAYAYSFDAEGEAGKIIKAVFAGEEVNVALTGANKTFSNSFNTGATLNDKGVRFIITAPGTYYLDNVSLVEDSLIKNGSFDAGLVGYDPFVDSSADATYVVDSLKENNAFDITINDTGDQDWKIQLKQSNVRLEEGKWYRLSLDMKSSIERDVIVAIQRDGNAHKTEEGKEDWTPYVQETVGVGTEYETYEFVFKMNPDTEPKSDPAAIFNVAMGAVNGEQIKTQHRICVDNILLEEIDEPAEEIQPKDVGEELISSGNFEDSDDWSKLYNAIASPATGTVSLNDNGELEVAIVNPGNEDWNVQLKHDNIQLEKGEKYALTFKAKSTKNRKIAVNLMTQTYDWYAGSAVTVGDSEVTYVLPFTVTKDTNTNIGMFISMGSPIDVGGVKEAQSGEVTLIFSDFSLKKVNMLPDAVLAPAVVPDEQEPGGDPDPNEDPEDNNMVGNGDFASGLEGWGGPDNNALATVAIVNQVAEITVTNLGEHPWDIQFRYTGLNIVSGKKYKVTFRINSSIARTIDVGVQQNYSPWGGLGASYPYITNVNLTDDASVKSFEFVAGSDCEDACLYFSLGKRDDEDGTLKPVIKITDVSMIEVTE